MEVWFGNSYNKHQRALTRVSYESSYGSHCCYKVLQKESIVLSVKIDDNEKCQYLLDTCMSFNVSVQKYSLLIIRILITAIK